MTREAFVLTHMLGRFLDDFGNVIRYLDRDGFAVSIYASPPVETATLSTDSPEISARYRRLLAPSVTVRQLPYCRDGKAMPAKVARMLALGCRLGRAHPDAIFLLWSVPVIVACGLPLRLLNRKCLFMVTGLGPALGGKDRRFRLLRRLLLVIYGYLLSGRNSRCLNHNAEDKTFLTRTLRIEPDKFFVTPGCGVDPQAFPYVAERAGNAHPVVVVPGRLIVDKGIREAIEASRILHERGVVHEMWFTGSVEPYPWISIRQDEVDRAGWENPSVRFLGYQVSMAPVYAKADIVCLPTRYPEGTPTALIEATASGRVAVTCDTVGAREIVLNGRTGLVVPQRDPRALADALEALMSDPDRYERLRREAHRHFRAHYTKDMALRATLAAFESLGFSFHTARTSADIRVPEPTG